MLQHASERQQQQTAGENVPYRAPKKLIVACDGTWQNSFGEHQLPTNVTHLARAVKSADAAHHPQIVYYQQGIGTGLGFLNHVWAGATGAGLSDHIIEAYEFLANNYTMHDELDNDEEKRDSIFLLGFSRGAYTARSIGGLLGAVGLLTTPAMPYCYLILQDWEQAGNRGPKFFKKWNADYPEKQLVEPLVVPTKETGTRNIDKYMDAYRQQLVTAGLTQVVKVNAIGVFDTVGSLGIPVSPLIRRVLPFIPPYLRDYAWFDTRLGKHVRIGFQALAIDEHRAPYQPAIWDDENGDQPGMRQTWFPGSHSDVGGGHQDSGIADWSLAWMMDHLSNNDASDISNEERLKWIEFEDYAIDNIHRQRMNNNRRSELPPGKLVPTIGYLDGTVTNTSKFPQSLLGKTLRTPGQYVWTNYFSQKQDQNKPLKNTHEYIHETVRLREEGKGRAPEPDWKTVFPRGINAWPWVQKIWWRLFTNKLKGTTGWPNYQPCAKGQPLQNWLYEKASDSSSDNAENTSLKTGARWKHQRADGRLVPDLPEEGLGHYQRRLKYLELNPVAAQAQLDAAMDRRASYSSRTRQQ